MSVIFFCANCGNNLIYISGRRLKCYKCEKYYTENFICRCQRQAGFKFSAEIIAPNKVKCHFCGREVRIPASLEPPSGQKIGEKILIELIISLNEKITEETAKVFNKLGEQILECHRTIQALAVALSEKGILTWEDINRARQKINDYEKTGDVIDWDKIPRS